MSLSTSIFRHVGRRPIHPRAALRRPYSTQNANGAKERSPHAQFYSDMLPAMVPIALLGSSVYLGLRLLQSKLFHERWLDETQARVAELEREVEQLRVQQAVAHPTAGPATPDATKKRGWLW